MSQTYPGIEYPRRPCRTGLGKPNIVLDLLRPMDGCHNSRLYISDTLPPSSKPSCPPPQSLGVDMVHWKSPSEIATDTEVYARLWPIFMGIYIYDFLQTFWFEWKLVTRKLPFKWPYIPYFVGRYSLIVMFGVMNTPEFGQPGHCDGRFYVLTISTAFGTGCASLNLAIRTIIIWHRQMVITAIVVLLVLGQWAVLFLSAGKFIHTGTGQRYGVCLAEKIYNSELLTCYIYTLIFDLIILAGALAGLLKDTPTAHVWRLSDIRRLLVVQGLGYFLITLVINVVSAVFAALKLNPIMDIMLGIPALVISMIASSRCVTGLLASKDRLFVIRQIPSEADCPSKSDQLTTHCLAPNITVIPDLENPGPPAASLENSLEEPSSAYEGPSSVAPCHHQLGRTIEDLPC
ncbi:hypothetical protein OE88DRAFT_1807802 [Heliocybe sulcata]|uniref:Uncharacterized protein n=1 Tax=Heliocybe sulcata TaxID=5364 RepID=A0A5C3N2P4_9AGAM|nr:hypothetical protein OE88DRAFT_1807802 [Heliocybe sulcata]